MGRRTLISICWTLASFAYARCATADPGCSTCFQSGGCVWACGLIFGVEALPVWAVLSVVFLVLSRLRGLLAPLIALPLAYVGAVAAIKYDFHTLLASLAFTALPVFAWYSVVLLLPHLRARAR